MDYSATLEFLYSRLPMYSRIGAAAYKADLHNTIALCSSLGNPQSKFRSIHVAGTNGKGSVSHMIASILQEAGYRTGLYTSPHLRDFRERFRINGNMIPEPYVISFTERMQQEIEKISPSFFELTVAMAFKWFTDEKVDVAVIETGLGGRLDSTNVITPELSVITNIGFDHMNILGDTLEKIAWEKSGIIKEHVPVVIGETLKETKPLFHRAAKDKGSDIRFADAEREVRNWQWQKDRLTVEVRQTENDSSKQYILDLPGLYQVKNLITVLACIDELNKGNWKIEEEHIQRGLAHTRRNTGLKGRWETIGHNPDIILDVAHNAEGVREVLHQIKGRDHKKLHLVIGFANDKDINSILELLPASANYYFTRARIPRACESEKLRSMAAAFALKGNSYPDVNEALRDARKNADEKDLIVVFGSVFLVGEVAEL